MNNQNMSYSSPGTYIIQLVVGNGFCTVFDTLHVIVLPFPDPIVYIPNVFTPNGDGSNDTFTIDTDFAESLEIQIFNRWGNVVKEISGLNESWNGMVDNKEASDGVYFFKYTVTGINGEILTGHGNVTLIR
jgi:gliding motility-associated-like protein